MQTYFLTVFKQTGETLLDKSFEAANEEKAKEIGQSLLREHDYEQYTHRCVSSNANLLLFHS